ncbi:MAG: DUF1571 domain-containing protein [Bacteroidia bacterium]
MRSLRPLLLVPFIFLLFGAGPGNNELTCREIIERMLDTIKNIQTQSCDVKATERIGKRLMIAESSIKINYYPRRIYFRNVKGIEVLWAEGSNKGNAYVHTPAIPLLTVDLDPLGSIMRKDQHHTIFDLGSPYIGSTVAQTILKAPREFDKHFAYAGIVTWNNRECYQVVISYPEYNYVEYVTAAGETVTSISKKLNTSDYKIRYKNELSSYYGKIKAGKKLNIPIPYSNKGILYIDKKTFLPVSVKVYDEEGLFEAYEFTNMKTNIVFAADEFKVGYKGYGF